MGPARVDETAREVEMHRPDGVPDAVEQVKHGVLQVLAQIKAIGHPIMGIIEPTLREYTHLGDAASNTDGRIYSEKLGPNEVDGNFSGKPDDRWAFTTKMPVLQYGAAASLAAASQALKGWDDPLAKECLDTAVKLYEESTRIPRHRRAGGFGPRGMAAAGRWNAALELLIATNGGEIYKKRVLELFPTIRQRFVWLQRLDGRARPALHGRGVQKATRRGGKGLRGRAGYRPGQDSVRRSAQPATWGGSAAGGRIRLPDVLPAQGIPGDRRHGLHAAGRQLPAGNASGLEHFVHLLSRDGLEVKAYGNNRADNTFIPGGMIPGYIVIKPDFPECIDDFGFLWFEDEYTISVAGKWILAANAADAIVREGAGGQEGMK